jgi:hypothetical protein
MSHFLTPCVCWYSTANLSWFVFISRLSICWLVIYPNVQCTRSVDRSRDTTNHSISPSDTVLLFVVRPYSIPGAGTLPYRTVPYRTGVFLRWSVGRSVGRSCPALLHLVGYSMICTGRGAGSSDKCSTGSVLPTVLWYLQYVQ